MGEQEEAVDRMKEAVARMEEAVGRMMETWLPLGDPPPQLHRLPNGTWIRLVDVKVISPYESLEKAEVTITLEDSDDINLRFETLDDAMRYADELAALTNEIK